MVMSGKPSFRLKPEHFLTRDESLALKKLFKSYTTATAEVLFTHSEIKVLKHLVNKKHKQSTKNIADNLGMARVTVKKDLVSLQDKGLVETETQGRRVLWWFNESR